MPGTTSPDNLAYPVVGDNVSPRLQITQLATTVQTALTNLRSYDNPNRVTDFYGTAANIGTVTPKDGDTYRESDGNKLIWRRVGGVWVTNEGGMFLLRPNSVTNGATDAAGSVVPTPGTTTISMDFTTAIFARFRCVNVKFFLEPTAAASPAMQFRRGGSPLAAAASYGNQRQLSNGATRSSDYVTGTFFDLGVSAQDVTAGEVTLFNLGESATRKAWVGSIFQGPSNPQNVQIAGQKNDAEVLAAIDGLTITFGAGTFKSGSKNFIKVYGLA